MHINDNYLLIDASKCLSITMSRFFTLFRSEVVDIDIEDNGDGTVNIYYTVADAGDYTLSIKFGGQPVPDGIYTFTVSKRFITFD